MAWIICPSCERVGVAITMTSSIAIGSRVTDPRGPHASLTMVPRQKSQPREALTSRIQTSTHQRSITSVGTPIQTQTTSCRRPTSSRSKRFQRHMKASLCLIIWETQTLALITLNSRVKWSRKLSLANNPCDHREAHPILSTLKPGPRVWQAHLKNLKAPSSLSTSLGHQPRRENSLTRTTLAPSKRQSWRGAWKGEKNWQKSSWRDLNNLLRSSRIESLFQGRKD